MGFRIRWIFLLLCIVAFLSSLLVLRKQSCSLSSCKACTLDDKLEEISLNDINQPKFLSKSTKFLQAEVFKGVQNEVHYKSWKEGSVVDCVMWDEKYKYDIHNLTLQDFTARTSSKGSEGVNKRRKTFQSIFEKRDWPAPNDTSYTGLKASGPGATLHNAQRVMAVLHSVVTRLKAHLRKKKISILDVPCGDLQWMSRWLDTRWDVDYTGVDIVPEIIANHKKAFKRIENAEFLHLDVVSENLNRSFDLILCRDMLQHLWLSDALTTLQRLSDSGSRFLLVTTFTDTGHNEEVDVKALGGRHYSYNLELAPFSLPPPICLGYDWNIEHLGLWSLPLKQLAVV